MKAIKRKNALKSISHFDGSETVKWLHVNETDFSLPIANHVARFDTELLSNYWNENYTVKKLSAKIFYTVVLGLPGRLYHIIVFYLVLFYAFNYLRINLGCVPSHLVPPNKLPDHLKEIPPRNDNESCLGPDVFDFIETANNNFFTVLTFLLGVYVTRALSRFWTQVSSLPRMDNIALHINTLVWSDPTKKECDVEILEGMSVKQFKMTIIRWMLLSWTMCLSKVSLGLSRKMAKPKDFNDKRLLTKNEYHLLKGSFSGDEQWLFRWNVPLVWASKLIIHATQCPKDPHQAFIKQDFILSGTILKFQNDLRMILNHYTYKPSRMLFQAMTCALYTFLFLGILGVHSDVYGTYDKVSPIVKLLWLTPSCIYQILKFLLIFGWSITAKNVQNPFGDDE